MGQVLAGRLIVCPSLQRVLPQRLALFLAFDILGNGLAHQVMGRAVLRLGPLVWLISKSHQLAELGSEIRCATVGWVTQDGSLNTQLLQVISSNNFT